MPPQPFRKLEAEPAANTVSTAMASTEYKVAAKCDQAPVVTAVELCGNRSLLHETLFRKMDQMKALFLTSQ